MTVEEKCRGDEAVVETMRLRGMQPIVLWEHEIEKKLDLADERLDAIRDPSDNATIILADSGYRESPWKRELGITFLNSIADFR